MNTVKEFNCVFCKETFDNKEELQIHFRKHGDPKFNPNTKNYKHRQQNESVSNVEKASAASEMVSCDVCSEVFPTISKAITHKHKVHPNHDAKYFCPWCGKLFTMKHLFNKHVASNHHSQDEDKEVDPNNLFHCELCEVTFYLPPAMLYHNKFFHRQDTEMPTIGHSKLQKVIQQELMPIYYCPFCGEEYINKVNLHKHMVDDHSDENQSPDEVLRCPLCDALFYHLDAYEVHLTLHSHDDVYREINEMNKNIKEITEYTLESVPPVKEKVEDIEPQESVESSMNAMGLVELLQVAINTSTNEDQSTKRMKVKKNKKHKKSKKTITLDEFLNMNKDVFGEGLGDVQGIEEVPTQVVTKRLKKSVKQPLRTGTKLMSSDIEKLKKQGIVIKMKPNTSTITHSNSSPIPSVSKKKTSSEVLAKLFNESNSQTKLIHKESLLSSEDPKKLVTSGNEALNNLANNTPGNNEENCDGLGAENLMTATDCKNVIDSELSKKKCKPLINSEIPEDNSQSCRNEAISSKIDDNDDAMNKETDMKMITKTNSKTSDQAIVNTAINLITGEPKGEAVILKLGNTRTEFVHDKNEVKCTPTNLDKLKKLSHLTIKPTNAKKDNIYNFPSNSTQVLKDTNSEIQPIIESTSLNTLTQSDENSGKFTRKSLSDLRPTINRVLEKSHEIHQNNDSESNDDDNVPNFRVKSEIPCIKENSKDNTSKVKTVIKNLCDHLTIKSTNPRSPVNNEVNEDTFPDTKTSQQTQKKIELTKEESLGIVKNINSSVTIKSISKTHTQKNLDENESYVHPDIKTEPGNNNMQNDNNLQSDLLKNTFKNIGSGIIVRAKTTLNRDNEKSMDNIMNAVPQANTKDNMTCSVSNFTKKMPASISKEINNDIEIFNIDDSDDEEVSSTQTVSLNKQTRLISNVTSTKSISHIQNSQFEAIKNVSNNITIKAKNMSTVIKQESNYSEHSNDSKNVEKQNLMKDQQLISKKLEINDSVQKVLKNLGKHISIKSRNSSPSTSLKNDENASRESFASTCAKENDDSNSGDGQVQIKDVTDDYNSNDEIEKNKHVCIKSPKDSEDEGSPNKETVEDFTDIESQIKTNKLPKTPSFMNTLRNISKNITVKSVNDVKSDTININSIKPEKVTNKEIVLYNPNRSDDALQSSDSINKQIKKQGSRSFNQVQQKSVAASNETSQEVSVKRFETKTIIQEITTTVTKTVRTVNQTVQKEIKNSSQVIRQASAGQIARPNLKLNAFHGVKVRQATTPMPRLRNPVNVIRPQMVSPSRPSQQIVAVRPSSNTARLSRPRMPANLQQNFNLGKPLKISPNVNLNATVKRPAIEEDGPFSCFKKPKESLIPVPDFAISTDTEGSSTEHYSTLQTTKSDYKTATSVKGNAVVKSLQVKSETSVSTQKLKKLSNMSGFKMMKTSHTKQESQVEERSEGHSRMTTLAAIDKLQKQGLLIKKPRIEGCASNHSYDKAQD